MWQKNTGRFLQKSAVDVIKYTLIDRLAPGTSGSSSLRCESLSPVLAKSKISRLYTELTDVWIFFAVLPSTTGGAGGL